MAIVVKLSPALEEILRDRAHHQGQDMDVVASELLARVLLADSQGAVEAMQARELETLLERFENQYQMDSRSFYQKFQSGAIGDSADFFEWNTYYEMLNAS
jgi:hypothetical protein